MSDGVNLGRLNGHSVGRILKEAVRRAAAAIWAERTTFEAHSKLSYSGTMDDVFTSADKAAQEVYVRTLRECFPGTGLIGEEDSLSIEPTAPITAYFTIDPLDGTKAFIRRQSHGIATMVALVDINPRGEREVISAYVGDLSSDEVYGFRPGSERVHRITHLDTFEPLAVRPESLPPLKDVFVLLRDPAEQYSALSQAFVVGCRSYEIMGSSIGTWTARLWKGEVGALLLKPNHETPWDSTPVIGISKKMGFVHMRPEGGEWVAYDPPLVTKPEWRDHDVLVIHSSYVEGGRLKRP